MVNRRRGEVYADLGGSQRKLVLTLGALCELEAAFGADDMVALAQRFETGRLSARDAVRIIAAGLRGAGEDISDVDVAQMAMPNGVGAIVQVVAELLAVTFSGDENG